MAKKPYSRDTMLANLKRSAAQLSARCEENAATVYLIPAGGFKPVKLDKVFSAEFTEKPHRRSHRTPSRTTRKSTAGNR